MSFSGFFDDVSFSDLLHFVAPKDLPLPTLAELPVGVWSFLCAFSWLYVVLLCIDGKLCATYQSVRDMIRKPRQKVRCKSWQTFRDRIRKSWHPASFSEAPPHMSDIKESHDNPPPNSVDEYYIVVKLRQITDGIGDYAKVPLDFTNDKIARARFIIDGWLAPIRIIINSWVPLFKVQGRWARHLKQSIVQAIPPKFVEPEDFSRSRQLPGSLDPEALDKGLPEATGDGVIGEKKWARWAWSWIPWMLEAFQEQSEQDD